MNTLIRWAKLSKLRPGDMVRTHGFSCRDSINSVPVQADESNALYVLCCENGRHYLEGQLLDDGDTLIGVELTQGTSP